MLKRKQVVEMVQGHYALFFMSRFIGRDIPTCFAVFATMSLLFVTFQSPKYLIYGISQRKMCCKGYIGIQTNNWATKAICSVIHVAETHVAFRSGDNGSSDLPM